jgi:hypothetical protein
VVQDVDHTIQDRLIDRGDASRSRAKNGIGRAHLVHHEVRMGRDTRDVVQERRIRRVRDGDEHAEQVSRCGARHVRAVAVLVLGIVVGAEAVGADEFVVAVRIVEGVRRGERAAPEEHPVAERIGVDVAVHGPRVRERGVAAVDARVEDSDCDSFTHALDSRGASRPDLIRADEARAAIAGGRIRHVANHVPHPRNPTHEFGFGLAESHRKAVDRGPKMSQHGYGATAVRFDRNSNLIVPAVQKTQVGAARGRSGVEFAPAECAGVGGREPRDPSAVSGEGGLRQPNDPRLESRAVGTGPGRARQRGLPSRNLKQEATDENRKRFRVDPAH